MTANRATYAILAHHHHPRILIRRIRAGSDALRATLDGRPGLPAPRHRREEERALIRALCALASQTSRSELLFLIKIDYFRFPREHRIPLPETCVSAIWASLKKEREEKKIMVV